MHKHADAIVNPYEASSNTIVDVAGQRPRRLSALRYVFAGIVAFSCIASMIVFMHGESIQEKEWESAHHELTSTEQFVVGLNHWLVDFWFLTSVAVCALSFGLASIPQWHKMRERQS